MRILWELFAMEVRFKKKYTPVISTSAKDTLIKLSNKIINNLGKITDKPLKILNLGFPAIKVKYNQNDCRIMDASSYPACSTFNQFITAALNQQVYDLVLGINYSEIASNYPAEDIIKIIKQVALSSSISIYQFPNYQEYSSNLILKEVYRYREIIQTEVATVLVFCSNLYWYANGIIDKFEQPLKDAREWVGKVDGTRRYYFNTDYILIENRFSGQKK